MKKMGNFNMMTENMKTWLKALYLNEATDHYAMARHEHLCALGSPTNEIATIHEMSADEHRAYAIMLMGKAIELDKGVM